MSESMSGPEGAAYYESLRKDRAASLPLGEVVDLVGHLAATGASLRRLIAGGSTGTGATAREPAAPSGPRNAAAEAPATSPLATRVLTALMDMPDLEFLAMANKVIARYHAAVAALAPVGAPPHPVPVECVHCHAMQTHRVCHTCFPIHGPTDFDG